MRRFLTYVVEQKLGGEGGSKEQTIAVAVFDKPLSFDPRLDPIVRVEARRLRSRLTEYYAVEGTEDPILIDLPLGGYEPEFHLSGTTSAAREEHEPPSTDVESNVPSPSFQAVAVLPFLDMSAEQNNQSFCDGLTEELINGLTRIEGLEVVARSSAFQFHGPAHDVRSVGKNLGVGTVMEGSVRRAGDRVRITAQLTNANSGFHLWSETYDATMDDVFGVQESIARQIVHTVSAQRAETLTSALTKRHSSKPEAYRSYLSGLYHLNQANPHDLSAAVAAFERAINSDPEYALAYAGLAMTHCKKAWLMIEAPGMAWPVVKKSAIQALELDSACTPGRVALGCAHCVCDWNWSAGEDEFKAALELDPGDQLAREWYALVCLSPLGRFDEALAMAMAVAERSGYSLYSQNYVGLVDYYGREFEEAAARHRATLTIKKDFAPALWNLGRSLVQLSRLEEAAESFMRAVAATNRAPLFLGSLGACYALMGREDEAHGVLRELRERAQHSYVSPLPSAWISIALGDHDQAFLFLDSAVEERSTRVIELDVDPVYDDVREDSRFAELRTRVCLDLSDGVLRKDQADA
ncbi:MAG: hypothetical protein R2748_26125 [Bryobacterales bacterium]